MDTYHDKDVSSLVKVGNVDDENMPILQCVCGEEFDDWVEVLGIYREHAWECPKCLRHLYFICSITVYEVNPNYIKGDLS